MNDEIRKLIELEKNVPHETDLPALQNSGQSKSISNVTSGNSFTYTGTFGQWYSSLRVGAVATAMGKATGDYEGIYKVVFFDWNHTSESILKRLASPTASYSWNVLTCWFFVVDMNTVHFRFVTDKGSTGGKASISSSDFQFGSDTSLSEKGYVTEYIPT